MDAWVGGRVGGWVGGWGHTRCASHLRSGARVPLPPPGPLEHPHFTTHPSPHSPRFKVNLLTSLPLARGFLRGDWFPEKLNHGFTKYAFAVVSALQRD